MSESDIEVKLEGLEPTEWEKKPEKKLTRHKRYDFIDQFRGLTILFLIITSITWVLGKYTPTLSIPILDHGWHFYDPGRTTWNWLQQENQMYTIVDIGSSMFMFILGVTTPISFRSRQKKFGTKGAFLRMLIRVGFFYGLVALEQFVGKAIDYADDGEWSWPSYYALFFNETLAALAWGTIIATLSVYFIKEPDKRFLVSIGLNVLHAVLYSIPALSAFRHGGSKPYWMGPGQFFDVFFIPWNLISFGAIAVAGSCFWDWFDEKKPVASIRRRHLPVAMYSLIATFILGWFITFEHHDLTVPQNLLSIGASFFLLILFFCFEAIFKFKIPLLTPLGRNAILMFILLLIPGTIFEMLGVYDFAAPERAWYGLVLCVIAVAINGAIAYLLHRKKLYLRV
ncbi:MAG: hypothetical protein ACTSWN_10875 [Promethearchaeota archaeon]